MKLVPGFTNLTELAKTHAHITLLYPELEKNELIFGHTDTCEIYTELLNAEVTKLKLILLRTEDSK